MLTTARREDHDCDQTARDRAPDREAALPDLEGARDPALTPLVTGEQVVDARADHARDHDGYRDLGDDLGVMLPVRRQRTSAILAATSTPMASMRP